jgi:hypothetical protein
VGVTLQQVREMYMDKEVHVCIKDVNPDMRKVVLSMQQASSHKVLKTLQVGCSQAACSHALADLTGTQHCP